VVQLQTVANIEINSHLNRRTFEINEKLSGSINKLVYTQLAVETAAVVVVTVKVKVKYTLKESTKIQRGVMERHFSFFNL